MQCDVVIEDDRWTTAGLEALVTKAAAETLAHLTIDTDGIELAVLGCDDARIAVLNSDFRGKPQPTNVLSWPSSDLSATAEGGHPRNLQDLELGDIAISYDTCAAEAASAGIPLEDHATHLIVHAVLHLLGYDHVRDRDATLMEGLEVEILGKMGLHDPYTVD